MLQRTLVLSVLDKSDGLTWLLVWLVGGGAVQRARAAVQPGGTAASATPKEGPPAEVLAVRHAALASLHKAQEGSPDATASTSPRRPHGVPLQPRLSAQLSVCMSCNLASVSCCTAKVLVCC